MRSTKSLEVRIDRFNEDGQGMGMHEGRYVLAWGALPGELVRVECRKKKGFLQGVVTDVLEPSPHRIEPRDGHYLSCSPWQVLSPDKESGFKLNIAHRVFKAHAVIELPEGIELVEGTRRFGYRNKMEFSFASDDEGRLSLAFFRRLSHFKMPIAGCVLATDAINAAAAVIVEALRKADIDERSLKTLVMRSNTSGEVLAALFVMDKDIDGEVFAECAKGVAGFRAYYSDPRSPASVPTEELFHSGEESFIEELSPDRKTAIRFRAGLMSFFQVNTEVFTRALSDMASYLDGREVVEYYSGVGAISIGVSGIANFNKSLLVDSDADAIEFARENIRINGLEDRFTAESSLAEKMRDAIESEKTVVFDPPRSGMHPKVLKRVAEVLPERVVYLSCNIKTQARDLKELLPNYDVEFSRLYNFFPRTPHIESLLVLQKKG